jgi:hypothetical protein
VAISRGISIDECRIPFYTILTVLGSLYLSTGYWAFGHIIVKDGHYLITIATAIHVIQSKRVRWSIRHFLVEEEIPHEANCYSRI